MKSDNTKIFTIVLLLGAYLICQAIADIGATKFVAIGSVAIPGGTFIFALTFTLRDIIHKRLGKDWAVSAIIVAGIMNLLQSAYLYFVSRLQAPVFFELSDAWAAIFSIVPAITLGSILAEVLSELVDTYVYHFVKEKLQEKFQWLRVLISNAISLPLDSLVFAMFAFVILPPLFGSDSMPVAVAISLTGGQIIYKAIVTLVSIPLIYTVKEKPL